MQDFRRDGIKYLRYKDPVYGYMLKPQGRVKAFKGQGFKKVEVPRMGTQRFILCQPGIVSPELLVVHASDHGLLHVKGRIVRVVVPAPHRESVAYKSEIRLLRLHWPYNDRIALVKAQPQLFERQPTQANLEITKSPDHQITR